MNSRSDKYAPTHLLFAMTITITKKYLRYCDPFTYEWVDSGCVLSQTGQIEKIAKRGMGSIRLKDPQSLLLTHTSIKFLKLFNSNVQIIIEPSSADFDPYYK